MPRIEALDPKNAPEKSRELLEALRAKMGMVPNLVRTMAHSPATLGGYVGLSSAVAGGSLSAREREQISLAVSEVNGCGYCLAAHSAAGKMAGMSALEVLDARRGTATSTRENAIVAFAREVLDTRGRVADATLARLRNAGITEAAITEIVAAVALNVFTNYFNQVARTVVDFPAAAPLEADRARTA